MTPPPDDLARRFDHFLTVVRSRTTGEVAWVGLLCAAATLHAAAWIAALAQPDLIDFAAFVDNARSWLAGEPYPEGSRDPNTPHTILLFLPFVGLSNRVGTVIWLLVSLGFAVAAVLRIRRELAAGPTAQVWITCVALLAISPMTLDVIANGNMIFSLWWLFTLAWGRARETGDRAGAGIVGALSTAKPFLGLWFPYFLLRRRWAQAWAMAVAGAVTLALSLVVAGREAWIDWFGMLGRIRWDDIPLNASVMGLLSRTWEPNPAVWGAVAAAVLAVTAWRLVREPLDPDRDWLLLLLSALLIAPLGWRYYGLLAIGPLLAWLQVRGLGPIGLACILVWMFAPTSDALAQHQSLWISGSLGSSAFWALLSIYCVVAWSRGAGAHRRPALGYDGSSS